MKHYEIKSITDEEIMDSTFDYKVEADKETVLPEGKQYFVSVGWK